MNDKVRRILRGTGTASLIVAGTLPLMSNPCNSMCTSAKSKKTESSKSAKTQTSAAAKKSVEKSAPAKANSDKAKSSK